jgi:PAS domain-containing protein
VLGPFAQYSSEPRIPTDAEIELIEGAGHIALIAIERQRSHRALQEVLVEIKNSESKLRTIIDTIPALAWSARPDGSAEFFNRSRLDYAGLSAEGAVGIGLLRFTRRTGPGWRAQRAHRDDDRQPRNELLALLPIHHGIERTPMP